MNNHTTSITTNRKHHYRELLAIGIPIIIGQLGTIILGFADTLMIGHHSTPELAAAGLVNNIFGLVFVSYMGFTYGLTPIIGRLYGEERTDCIGQKVRNAFCANMLTGIIFTLALIVLYLNLGRIGQPEELLSLIRPYFLVNLASVLFMGISYVVLKAAGAEPGKSRLGKCMMIAIPIAAVIGGVVTQFWTDVLWDVDYLLVDMPPGTGDVTLSVFQSIPLSGIVVVASPQELVGMVVEKAVKMAEKMAVPIVGLVENMSYLICPDCGRKIYLFGEGRSAEAAKKHGIPLLAQMPIDPQLAALTDEGRIEEFKGDWLADAVTALEAR